MKTLFLKCIVIIWAILSGFMNLSTWLSTVSSVWFTQVWVTGSIQEQRVLLLDEVTKRMEREVTDCAEAVGRFFGVKKKPKENAATMWTSRKKRESATGGLFVPPGPNLRGILRLRC